MVTSDYHIPYMDDKAYSLMRAFAKDYKPNVFVINGDMADFYSLSDFDKNPDHFDLQYEIDESKRILKDLRNTLGNKTTMYMIGDNHMTGRLQRYLWKNPEIANLDVMKMENLLDLDKYKVKYIGADMDYWKKTDGSLKLGNVHILHGDSRMNGASTSKYSGYSAKNTVQTKRQNVIMGHVHRLAHHYNSNEDGTLHGIEDGCLCQEIPTANWQQGFVTFEIDGSYKDGKGENFQLHHIDKGKLYGNNKIYKVK